MKRTFVAALLCSILMIGCSEDAQLEVTDPEDDDTQEQTTGNDDEIDDEDDEDDNDGDDESGGDDEPVVYATSDPIESIPLPTLGMRWVANDDFTDEFNDTSLDTSKWNDYHSNWAGRAPALFLPENVYVEDGNFVITSSELTQAQVTALKSASSSGAYSGVYKNITYGDDSYNIAGGALSSVNETAGFGYYEARIKGNKTTLSTTFWLSSKFTGSNKFTVKDDQPASLSSNPTYADLTYNEEIDILECVGYLTSFPDWAKYMHSNVHIKFGSSTVDNLDMDGYAGDQLFPPYDGTGRVYDQYNTYGCWWRDRENISFYLNDNDGTHGVFQCEGTGEYFYMNGPMGLNMVMESYDWIGAPTAAELVDDSMNKNYCDWVRAYVLVDVDAVDANGGDNYMFGSKIHFSEDETARLSKVSGGVEVQLAYTAPTERAICLYIYDTQETLVGESSVAALAGYGNAVYKITAELTEGETYYAVAKLMHKSYSSTTIPYDADSFMFRGLLKIKSL